MKKLFTFTLALCLLSFGQAWANETINLFYNGTDKSQDGSTLNTANFKMYGATINTSATSTEIKGKTFSHFVKLANYTSTIAADSMKVLAYDARTTHTKVTAYVKNGDSNNRDFYIGRIVEGETSEQTGSGKQVKKNVIKSTTDTIIFELDNTKNTLIGLFGAGKANWEIYQVIVEETGTPLLKAGENGYSLAFPGRVCVSGKATATTTPTIMDENITILGSGALKYLNGPLKIKQGTSYIKFTLNAETIVKVTPYNTRKFIFCAAATPTEEETVADKKKGGTANEEVSTTLEAGTWYLLSENTSELQLSKIEFETLASYTITYDANGGTGTMENSTNTISACTFTAPDGYEFKEWNTAADGKGTSYAAGATATSDLDLYAIWQVHATSSDATLSALSVAGCTLSPAFASGTTAYTVALPFYASMPVVGDVTATKNDSFAKDPKVTIADNVISIACEAEDGTKQTYTITVNIADVPAASTSINIEQLVLDNSKSYSYTTALTAANISYANLNGLDSLAIGDADNSRPDYNEPYLGLKIKKSGGYIQMVIPAGKTLKVKFGSIAANLKLTINGVAQSDISKSTSVYEHTATGNELIKIATSSDKTVVLKQIMIDEDITVVRPFEATIATTTNGTASVELEKYAKGEEVTVNCVPASGYKLASIAVSGYNDKGAETDVTVTGNKFTMPGSPVTITVTFSIATSINNTSAATKAQKRIENGQLVIEKNGQVFNAMGQTIR